MTETMDLPAIVGRRCFLEPIAEISLAAGYLDQAVSAHLLGNRALAENLINKANDPAIREWGESIWGKASPHIHYRAVPDAPPILEHSQRKHLRMPSTDEKRALHLRDGYHCRFCGIPVIRKEIRELLRSLYPSALPWGRINRTQHAAFQTLWAQYDHVLPHSRGGTNDLGNLIVVCAPCNFGRMSYTLEEVGLADPRTREPECSTWDGLERLLLSRTSSSTVAAE